MPATFKDLTNYLVQLGIDDVPHTKKYYLGHLIAVYRILQSKGCDEDVCRGGMFHSIYGTERFQGFKIELERRQEVRELIGERAERLAYLNCAMDRSTFDSAVSKNSEPYRFLDRFTNQEVVLSNEDFSDLCRIHLYDWLEQVPRSECWDYRKEAYLEMARFLGDQSVSDYEGVFCQAK